jgi:hypothetical protein
MQAEKTKVVNQCLDCKRDNLSSMHFCVYCGAALKRIFSTLCLNCNSNDELNGPNCIMCGASCDLVFYPKPETALDSVSQVPLGDRDAQAPSSPATWMTRLVKRKEIILAALCLSIFTVYGCVFLSRLYGVGRPKKPESKLISPGLIIFTKAPYATLVIEDEQYHPLTSTKFKPDGSLVLDKLPSGNYILKIAAPNHKAILKRVTITKGNPTVLGFPKPLELPPQPKPIQLPPQPSPGH